MVEPEENPVMAATRELKEETNIDLQIPEFKVLLLKSFLITLGRN